MCEDIGNDFGHSDLFRVAETIVEASVSKIIEPVADDREYGTPFENWAVDSVLSDGGWRLLCRNDATESWFEHEEAKEVRAHQAINRYLEEYR